MSFGVLPSAIGHAMGITGVAMAVLMFYTLCAVIRLGYFNVTEQKRQETTSENRTSFEGLPVTWSAVIVPLVSLVRLANESIMPWVMGGVLFIVGFCFIARIRVKEARRSERKRKRILTVFDSFSRSCSSGATRSSRASFRGRSATISCSS